MTTSITLKRVLAGILVVAGFHSIAQAQPVMENTYTTLKEFGMIHLHAGDKYYALGPASPLKLYNLDHSLWKTIALPVPAGALLGSTDGYISDRLFNNDNLVEVCYSYYFSGAGYTINVINEYADSILFVDGHLVKRIEPSSDGYKLITYSTAASGYQTVKVFALPGTLPCKSCAQTPSGILQGEHQSVECEVSPNPVQTILKITYDLPPAANEGTLWVYDAAGKPVRSYTVDRTFSELLIPTGDYAPGMYMYELRTDLATCCAGKFVVVR